MKRTNPMHRHTQKIQIAIVKDPLYRKNQQTMCIQDPTHIFSYIGSTTTRSKIQDPTQKIQWKNTNKIQHKRSKIQDACMYACMCAHMHTHIYMYSHIYSHPYIYLYITAIIDVADADSSIQDHAPRTTLR